MDILQTLLDQAIDLIPTSAAVAITLVLILIVRLFLNRRYTGARGHKFRLQITLLVISFVGMILVILTLPVSEGTVGQLLSLFGLLFSAAIALSATTFVGNIMAGLMLRAVSNFRFGDFVKVGDHFGRVTERGLFHIEIQTENRDLTTLPNLYLVTNPVKVVRSSGTLVVAEVSLGYDIPRAAIKQSLLAAAEDASLEEPFVHVVNLGDFAVTYRVAGLLTEVKSLLTSRSRLRGKMLDRLHEAGIEIVSPTFMNQRPLADKHRFIPAVSPESDQKLTEDLPESVVFDKADQAETIENLRERLTALTDEAKGLKEQVNDAPLEAEKAVLAVKLERLEKRAVRLAEYIEEREKETD